MDGTTRRGFSSRTAPPRGGARRPSQTDWLAQGLEFEDAGRSHEAMRCYRRAIAAGAESASLCFNLANVLHRSRRKLEAVDYYQRAVELDAGLHEAWNNLGVVLCELKQCDQAVWALQKAIDLAPWSSDAVFNLADCLAERGQHTSAEPYWRAYVQLDSKSEWGRYAQGQLSGSKPS